MNATAGPERLFDGLDDSQAEAVRTEAAVVRVTAGPGSGKTKVLTHRVAYRVNRGTAAPEHCLVVTFTRRAASQLRFRLGRLGTGADIAAGTLHSTALSLMKLRWSDRGTRVPAIVDRSEFLEAMGKRNEIALPKRGSDRLDAGLEIGWAASLTLSPTEYVSQAVSGGRLGQSDACRVAEIMVSYTREKARRSVMDLDDVLLQCTLAFDQDPAFAAAQRWRYRHLFVDEFQDLTPLQFRLLRAWAGDQPDLFAVGDVRQAIYAWNGSDPSLMEQLTTFFPSAVTVTLGRNYRCSPEIVAVTEGFAAEHLDGETAGPSPAARLTDGTVPRSIRTGATDAPSASPDESRPRGAVPQVHAFPSAAEESAGIARLLRLARGAGTPWSSMAVLVRTNAQIPPLASSFTGSGVPTSGESGDSGGVSIITFHRAKGLEWDTVVIACAEESSIPLAAGLSTSVGTAEEARLVYVGMTRASRTLHFTWAEQRGQNRRTPSRYLARIEEECRRLGEANPKLAETGTRERIRLARAALRQAE